MIRSLRDMTEPELHEYFNQMGSAIEAVLPAGNGRNGRALFVLLVFDEPGLTQYLTNAERADVIRAMREAADRLERNEDLVREEEL